jgi:hypothetical protein
VQSCVDSTRAVAPVQEHFSAVPNRIQDDARLKPRDLVTIAGILRYARQKPWASMSNRALCTHGRCEERTIQYSLDRLERAGWIRRRACPDAPGSRSGRLIYLTWRTPDADCTPPPRPAAPPPVPAIAPELESEVRERKTAPAGLGSPGPEEKAGDRGPLDYAALGWLDRPESDPLRRIAEKALAARLGPPAPAKPARPPRSLLGPPRTLAGMLGRQLGRK